MSTSYVESGSIAAVVDRRGSQQFGRIWFGQLVSLIGSGLTQFSIEIWVYQTTHSVSQYTLLAVFNVLPGLLLAPVAGAISDRFDRWKVMLYSNIAAGITTLLVIARGSHLRLWDFFLAVILLSVCNAFFNLAYTPLVSVLVPKENYGRASGMIQSAQAAGWIVPPLIGGMLMSFMTIPRIILIDCATYLVAISMLLLARVPAQRSQEESSKGPRALVGEVLLGWQYIWERPGLKALLIYFTLLNLVMGMAQVLYTPLVLSVGSATTVGIVSGISGGGFLLGGIAMSLWGGPRRKTHGIVGFGLLLGVGVLVGGFRPSVVLITISAFSMFLFLPIINGCSQAIWQSKTPIDLQGRVFSSRYMIALSTAPLSFFLAGPLVEKVFTPLTAPGGAFFRLLQPPAEPIRLIFLIAGSFLLLNQIGNYLYPRFRHLEDELPDADSTTPAHP